MTRRRWRKRKADRRCYFCADPVMDGQGAWVICGNRSRLVHARKCPRPPIQGGQGRSDREVHATVSGLLSAAWLAARIALAVLAGLAIALLLGCSRYTYARQTTGTSADGTVSITNSYMEEHRRKPDNWDQTRVEIPMSEAPPSFDRAGR